MQSSARYWRHQRPRPRLSTRRCLTTLSTLWNWLAVTSHAKSPTNKTYAAHDLDPTVAPTDWLADQSPPNAETHTVADCRVIDALAHHEHCVGEPTLIPRTAQRMPAQILKQRVSASNLLVGDWLIAMLCTPAALIVVPCNSLFVGSAVTGVRSRMTIRVSSFRASDPIGKVDSFRCADLQSRSIRWDRQHDMNKLPEHYDSGAMLLHWTVAVLVLCASLSSFFLNSAFSDSTTILIRTIHNVTGTLALGLVIVWFGWRALHAELPKLPTIGIGERRFMEVTNSIMNVLLVLVPLTGILHLYAIGKTVGNTHNVLGKLLLAIALLHSVHALWHHFGKRDGLVRRMLPWASK